MPKFLIKLICLFIPLKSWRKAFRKKMNRKNMFGHLNMVFTEIKAKRDTVLAHKDSCKIIALGSSHGAYGFNPEFIGDSSFNLCSNSQDFYTAEKILEYLQDKLPNLEKIVIFLDVFSKGWRLERTSAKHICTAYQYLYGIDYPFLTKTKKFWNTCKKLDCRPLDITENQNGYLNPPKLEFTDSSEARVQAHLREHNREESQYVHLQNIIGLISFMRWEGAIVIPPCRVDYTSLLPKNLLLNDAKRLVAETNIRIFDFSSDTDFTDDDFYDYDHLNNQGAEKLSKKLKGML